MNHCLARLFRRQLWVGFVTLMAIATNAETLAAEPSAPVDPLDRGAAWRPLCRPEATRIACTGRAGILQEGGRKKGRRRLELMGFNDGTLGTITGGYYLDRGWVARAETPRNVWHWRKLDGDVACGTIDSSSNFQPVWSCGELLYLSTDWNQLARQRRVVVDDKCATVTSGDGGTGKTLKESSALPSTW